MRMEQLEYLLSVYETGSFSLAAEKSHITQPTISQAINNLETELGVKVFLRTRLGAEPTPEGKIVIKKAIAILSKFNELKEEINLHISSVTGNLKLAIVPSICSSILPEVLQRYKNKYPLVNIEIFEKGSFEIINDVLTGGADVGVISLEEGHSAHNNLDVNYLLSTTLQVCVGRDYGFNSQKEISLEEIVQHPIVMFKSNYSMSRYVNKLLTDFGDINILFTSENTEVAKKVIAKGIGIGFFTELSLRNDPYILNGSIFALNIKNFNRKTKYVCINSKNKHLSIAAKEFIKELRVQAQLFK